MVGESVTSAPTEGPTRTTITVSGSGWLTVPDGTAVTFGYSTDPSCASAYTAATVEQAGSTAGGNFTGWFRWPDVTSAATYTVCATIGTAVTPAGSYTVLVAAPPQLSISAATFIVGQRATITGSNFLPPQTSVTLLLQKLNGGTSIPLGTVVSDAHGAFSQTYTVLNNPTGPVALIANGGGGTPPVMSASVTCIVYVTPTPTPTATPKSTPTPVPSQKTTGGSITTPTLIQTQGHTQAMAPIQTPAAASKIRGTAQTPGHEFSQSSPTTTTGNGHSSLLIILLAGTLFLLLLTAFAALFLWKKRRRQQPQRAIPPTINEDIQGTSNWVPVQDPFAKNAPVDRQKAEQFQTGFAPPAHSTTQASGDLLRDPLLEAIMQQARSGLFVLPGKGE